MQSSSYIISHFLPVTGEEGLCPPAELTLLSLTLTALPLLLEHLHMPVFAMEGGGPECSAC